MAEDVGLRLEACCAAEGWSRREEAEAIVLRRSSQWACEVSEYAHALPCSRDCILSAPSTQWHVVRVITSCTWKVRHCEEGSGEDAGGKLLLQLSGYRYGTLASSRRTPRSGIHTGRAKEE